MYTCRMETVQQNGRFTLFSSKFPSNIYSILNNCSLYSSSPSPWVGLKMYYLYIERICTMHNVYTWFIHHNSILHKTGNKKKPDFGKLFKRSWNHCRFIQELPKERAETQTIQQ